MPSEASHTNGYVYTPVSTSTNGCTFADAAAPPISRVRRKCFGKLTILEVCLIWLSLALWAALLATLVTWFILTKGFQQPWPGADVLSSSTVISSSKPKLCDTKECTLIAAHFLQNIDETANPCDDFYQFACGRFAEYHEVPSDKMYASLIQDIENKLNSRVRTVFEEPMEQETKAHQMVHAMYNSCMNEEVLEKEGKDPLLRSLNKLGGFPTLQPNWTANEDFSWELLVANVVREQGLRFIIESYITQHAENSSQHVIEIDQQKLGLKARKYYQNGTDDPIMKSYLRFILETLGLFGANENAAKKDMKRVIELETQLALISAPDEDRRDRNTLHNPMTIASLRDEFPQLKLEEYLRAAFPSNLSLQPDETVIVVQIQYLQDLAGVLRNFDERTITNYIMWRIVQESIDLLPQDYQDPKDKFVNILLGVSAKSPRWEQCVKLTNTIFPFIVGSMYVQKYFSRSNKEEVDTMTRNLKLAFIENLRGLDWMDSSTRDKALDKARMMVTKTGYPDYIFNYTRLLEDYKDVPIDGTQLYDNVVAVRRHVSTRDLLKLRMPVDREIWHEGPAVVDAYYAPSNNEIVFPAGILQFPFFTMGVPHFVNYAMIGAVIGHEITHGYDDEGRQQDKDGNLKMWWDNATLLKFFEKTKCLSNQYSGVNVPEIGKNLNGNLTLGENIADNGGMKTAYNAYQLWRKQNGYAIEPTLPGLMNYSSDQMFFIAYANNWCGIMRPETYDYFITGEVHSPGKYRAIVPLQNFDAFADAFKCERGSKMNPIDKCQVW